MLYHGINKFFYYFCLYTWAVFDWAVLGRPFRPGTTAASTHSTDLFVFLLTKTVNPDTEYYMY